MRASELPYMAGAVLVIVSFLLLAPPLLYALFFYVLLPLYHWYDGCLTYWIHPINAYLQAHLPACPPGAIDGKALGACK